MPANRTHPGRASASTPFLSSRTYPLLPPTSKRSHPFAFAILLPPAIASGDSCLEYRFPSINRIADVAWLSQKIVFEIQYSAIAAEEVIQRNRDYGQEGWKVVWILHDHRYNRFRLSAAEMALRSSPHFFSNMNRLGQGMVYDQFDICDNGLRKCRLPPLTVDLRRLTTFLGETSSSPLMLLAQRAGQWQISFEGDLMSLFLQDPSAKYLQQALEAERRFNPAFFPFKWKRFLIQLWKRGVAAPYQVFFRFLLERMCR